MWLPSGNRSGCLIVGLAPGPDDYFEIRCIVLPVFIENVENFFFGKSVFFLKKSNAPQCLVCFAGKNYFKQY